MNESCIIGSGGDYDSPAFISHKTIRARKRHKCCECSDDVVPGSKYVRVVGKWDDFCEYKICLVCDEIRRKLSDECCFGELWDRIDDYNLEDLKGCIAKNISELSAEAKFKIEKYLEMMASEAIVI